MKKIKRVLRKWLGPWLSDTSNEITVVLRCDTSEFEKSIDKCLKRSQQLKDSIRSIV